MLRKIVNIDQELCNGCGACANACHEGAIEMVNGKARLMRDDYCDGLGDCLPACPTNAISIIEREADSYDEAAVEVHMKKRQEEAKSCKTDAHMCPGMAAKLLKEKESASVKEVTSEVVNKPAAMESELMQWPVQIKLLPVKAPYFENANLLIAADCTAYAYANFHQKFIKNHITLVGCPKLDEGDYTEKLTEIIKNNNIKSVKLVRMEVPCCGGLERALVTALQNSGKMIPWQVSVISCNGELISEM